MAITMKKEIQQVCLDCGNKYKTKEKAVFGMWMGNCDMCGKKDTYVAAAGHDFGIYNTHEEKVEDKVQDLL
jgi:hypothetical protein